MIASSRSEPASLAGEAASPARTISDETSLGALRGAAVLSIQTRQAQRLVTGRRAGQGKRAIVGLLGFATLLRPIWSAARADDPYADWWLCRVHDGIEAAHAWLAREQAALTEVLASISSVDVSVATVDEPLQLPLAFGNPYGFRGAYLLAAYDRWVCTLLTAGHVGLRDRAEVQRLLQLGGRALRRAYATPLGYRSLGITRQDIRDGSEKAERAKAAMGDVPDDVLAGDRRAPYGPGAGTVAPDAVPAVADTLPAG